MSKMQENITFQVNINFHVNNRNRNIIIFLWIKPHFIDFFFSIDLPPDQTSFTQSSSTLMSYKCDRAHAISSQVPHCPRGDPAQASRARLDLLQLLPPH